MANELDGFKVYSFGAAGATVSITKNGVTFNKAAVDKLGNTQYVLLLINEDFQKFAVKKCSQNEPQAMPFLATVKPGAPSVRWGSKDFLRKIKKMTGWNLDAKECKGYKAVGEYIKSDGLIIFDLAKATPIT